MNAHSSADGLAIVRLVGELDLSTRDANRLACSPSGNSDVEVDLRSLTFLDCAGYTAIASARRSLAASGRGLTVTHAVGQPHFVLQLIRRLDINPNGTPT